MKKIVLSIVFAISAYSINVNAQVGINVASPSSTLDIVAKNATGAASSVDGLLVPRVNRQRAQSMTGVPTSTLIYVNGVISGSLTGTTINMDTVGYYYFNGSVWVKLKSTDTPDLNIYNSDGTLTGDRVVSQGANTLAFNGTAVNAFSVDGGTLSVDALNNRVGVGTAAPHAQLHLGSSVANRKIVMYETADNDNEFYGFGVNSGVMRYQADRTTTDHVFYAGVTGGASSNELMRIKGTGNVGIGESTPTNTLDVNGDVRVRTITSVANLTTTYPVAAMANGVLVKSANAYGATTVNNVVNVGSGSTVNLITGLTNGGTYKLSVMASDTCGDLSVAEFYIYFDLTNIYPSINGISGMISSPATGKSPVFNQVNTNTVGITWTGKANCSTGGGATSFNYTIKVSNGAVLTITNNGTASQTYRAVANRIDTF